MRVDYDLVVVGDTKAGIFAVEYALNFGAKVALFLDKNRYNNPLIAVRMLNEYWQNYSYLAWEDFCGFKQLIFQERLRELHSAGVDIYEGDFRLLDDKQILLSVGDILVKSPGIILALYPPYTPPYSQYNHLRGSFVTEFNRLVNDAPGELTIIGDDLEAVILATILSTLGIEINLITQNKRLLPSEDEDISWQYQLHLESRGVNIKLDSNIESHLPVNQDKMVITRVKQKKSPVANLYENLGIRWDSSRILANEKLQTHNPKVFACGEILGGYDLENLSYQEARVAVNNSLFFPWQSINYNNLVYSLNTSPKITRIGYSENEAIMFSGNKLKTIKFSLNNPKVFVKFIISDDGDILGFHSLGEGLEEIVNAVTVMKVRKEKISAIFAVNFSDSRCYRIVEKLRQMWLPYEKKHQKIIMDICHNFFLWKRTWL